MSTSIYREYAKPLGDILSADACIVPPDRPLSEVIRLMEQHAISSVIVAEKNRPVGIVTERDVVRIAYEGLDPSAFSVSQQMTSPIITAPSSVGFHDAYHLLIEHQIRHLVVVDEDGDLIGGVSESEIRKNLGFEYFAGLQHLTNIMTTELKTLRPDSKVFEAVALMYESQTDCVVVEVDQRPGGIITERDVVVLVQQQKALSSLTLREVMASPVRTYPIRKSASHASDMMSDLGIRRLVVTSDDGKIEGLITQHDILKGLSRKFFDYYKGIIVQQAGELQLAERQLSHKGVVLENILQSITDLAIVAADTEGHVVYRNPAMTHLFRLDDSRSRPVTLRRILSLGELDNHQIDQYLTQAREANVADFVMQISNTDGLRYLEIRITEMRDVDRRSVGFVMVAKDITTRKQADEQLRKLSRAVEHSPNAILITDTHRIIEYINPTYTAITGYDDEDVIGKRSMILESGTRDADVHDEILQRIDAGKVWRGEIQNKKKNGRFYWAQMSVSPIKNDQGVITHFIEIQQDITQARKISQKLAYHAKHDTLTGLLNRYEFEKRLLRVVETARNDGTEHALCYLDLDQFKVVNDSAGHVAGDELLRQLSGILKKNIRKRDSVARMGGDEFAILMEHCSLEQAIRAADGILHAIGQLQFPWEDKSYSVGASIGVVAISSRSENGADLLKRADAACYAAKDAGRNRVHVYRENDEAVARRSGEMYWVSRIQTALNENRFRLFSQPITPLKPNRNDEVHCELLIRMMGEHGEMISPGAFLPAAERYGLSGKIDRWVISAALHWLASCRASEQPACSINLSGFSLGDQRYLEYILQMFDSTGVPYSKVCFEITETAAISNLSDATGFIHKLKSLGCRFSLDDFGSGLSSFAYLKNLPVDYLKIDGMFVRDIIDDPIDLAMVKSINEIGHVMGKKTIAEFVENEIILKKIKALGVDYAQGYELGPPGLLQ